MSIWNTNSFGEFYLQIAGKYKDDYETGLARFCQARAKLACALDALIGLRVVPSQANHLMVELTNANVTKLTQQLLSKHHLLIKDLSGNNDCDGRQFIRVAIRSEEDNARLVEAPTRDTHRVTAYT